MRAKVICLLAAWQVANLVGFVSQGVIDATAKHSPRSDPRR